MEKSKFEKTNPKILIEIVKELKDRLKIKKITRMDWGFEKACTQTLEMIGLDQPEFIDLNYILNCYNLNVDKIDLNIKNFERPLIREWEFNTVQEVQDLIQLLYKNKITTYGDGMSTIDYIHYVMESGDGIEYFIQELVKKEIRDREHLDLSYIKGTLKEL